MSVTSVAPRNDRVPGEVLERRLLTCWHQARLNLGRRMWTMGIDDGSLAARIEKLDARIRQAASAQMPTAALQAKRTAHLLRLADLALEDDAPLPGADDEYRAAREAQKALAAGPGLLKDATF